MQSDGAPTRAAEAWGSPDEAVGGGWGGCSAVGGGRGRKRRVEANPRRRQRGRADGRMGACGLAHLKRQPFGWSWAAERLGLSLAQPFSPQPATLRASEWGLSFYLSSIFSHIFASFAFPLLSMYRAFRFPAAPCSDFFSSIAGRRGDGRPATPGQGGAARRSSSHDAVFQGSVVVDWFSNH